MPFYRAWILANGGAEALGLGTTFLLGRAAAPLLEHGEEPRTIVAVALAAVLSGAVLEGALVGTAQAWVLRRWVPGFATGAWVRATVAGAGLAWLLGMLPSTTLALTGIGSAAAGEPAEPSQAIQYGLALALGAVTGPVLAVWQWRVLRRYARPAGRWILANGVAWAMGMLLIFVGMDQVPWERGGLAVAGAIYLVCGGAGLVVGSIHGRVLRRLLERGTS